MSEGCLLTALAVRSCNLAAMGCLPKVLSGITAWAFAKAGPPLTGEDSGLHFGEATEFSAALLCAYRFVPQHGPPLSRIMVARLFQTCMVAQAW